MSPVRSYRADADPSLFMGVLKKMSFHAGNMGLPIVRLRQTTPDGKVTLMRVGDLEFVDIVPEVSDEGMWQFVFNFPSLWPLGEMVDYPYQKSLNCTIYLRIKDVYYFSSFSIDNRLLPKLCIPVFTGIIPTGFSNYYLQLYDILTVDNSKTTVSFSLRVLDNNEPLYDDLYEVQISSNPKEVTGVEFLCKYNVNIDSYDIFSYYPYPGYIIAEDFINWHLFTSDGWLKADNSTYSVDVTMIKYDGTLFDFYLGQDTMECNYLNNKTSDILYVPHSETTDPILGITDNYDYQGNLYNYIGEIVKNDNGAETTYFIDGENPFRIACKVGWDYRDFTRLGTTFRYTSNQTTAGYWYDGPIWHWEDEAHTIGHWEQIWHEGTSWDWSFVHTPILLPAMNTVITRNYDTKNKIIIPTEISS
jgi:hypothetical protein